MRQSENSTFDAVQGMALGGGCEATMACNARLAAPGTKLGLPELQVRLMRYTRGAVAVDLVAMIA